MIPEELLIFAGRGEYPEAVLAGARAAGVKRILVAGVRGMASRKLLRAADEGRTWNPTMMASEASASCTSFSEICPTALWMTLTLIF